MSILPTWATARTTWQIEAGSTIRVGWDRGVCTLAGTDVLGRPLPSFDEVGWLVLTDGCCDVTRHPHQLALRSPAIVTPPFLPVFQYPDRAWKRCQDSVTIVTTQPCTFEHWAVDLIAWKDRKKAGKIATEFNDLRRLALRGGVDPCLEILRARSIAPGAFAGVQDATGEFAQIDIEFAAIDSRDESWLPLVDPDSPKDELIVVLDGWMRYFIDVGGGPGARHYHLIDLARPPALIGDITRLLGTQISDPDRPSVMVDLKPLERDYAGVHFLRLPFALLRRWTKFGVLENLKSFNQVRSLELLHWLAAGGNEEWRVIKWLLDEHQRALTKDIWIPSRMLGYKILCGRDQSLGPEGLPSVALSKGTRGNKILRAFRDLDLIRDVRTSADSGRSTRHVVTDPTRLAALLLEAATGTIQARLNTTPTYQRKSG